MWDLLVGCGLHLSWLCVQARASGIEECVELSSSSVRGVLGVRSMGLCQQLVMGIKCAHAHNVS